MAILESILGRKPQGQIGEIACDASVREVHQIEADLTEYAIESGSDISDHYRIRPRYFIIDAIISNSPIATKFPGQSSINSITNLIAGSDPVTTAWAEFKRYMTEKERIEIRTGFEDYRNMMILSLTNDRETAEWMRVSIVARQIKTAYTTQVEALTAVAAEEAVAKSKTVEETTSGGAQAAGESSTLAKQAVDGLLATLGL